MSKYGFLRWSIKTVSSFYARQSYEGTENIPKDGAFIFAGNHVHLFDPAMLLCVTKRKLHFLAKASLFKFPKTILFKNMGLIPVNRDGKDHDAYEGAIEFLKKGEIVGIYPEGTRERGRGLLPFKTGAVRMSYEANVPIIPVVTIGTYKPFRKGAVLKFGKPYKAKKNIEKSNEELRNIIKEMLENK